MSRDAKRRRGARVEAATFEQNDGVWKWIKRPVPFNQAPGCRRLQRRELQSTARIARDDELNEAIAQITDAIKQHE